MKGASDGNQGRRVYIYIDPRKQVGDVEHLHVFNDKAAADAWFKTHEHREGAVAGSYQVHTALWGVTLKPRERSTFTSTRIRISETPDTSWCLRTWPRRKDGSISMIPRSAFEYDVRQP